MEKTTVLFRLHFTLALNRDAIAWLNNFEGAWFAQNEGNSFLRELGGTWTRVFDSVLNDELRRYFRRFEIPDESMPFVQHGETYTGSWVMDASVVMRGTMGRAFNALKGIPDLSSIADGFTNLKDGIIRKLELQTNEEVRNALLQSASNVRTNAPAIPPPARPAAIDLVIDARPMRSLAPAAMKAHKVHLSVAISRDVFTLENLDDEAMQDVRIGLFRSSAEQSQWNYADSYMGSFPLVSGRQTIAKNLGEFLNGNRRQFDLSDGQQVFVDCWVSDSNGIYLFHFFLETEY